MGIGGARDAAHGVGVQFEEVLSMLSRILVDGRRYIDSKIQIKPGRRCRQIDGPWNGVMSLQNPQTYTLRKITGEGRKDAT